MGLGGEEECLWQRTELRHMLGSEEKPHVLSLTSHPHQLPPEKLPLSSLTLGWLWK